MSLSEVRWWGTALGMLLVPWPRAVAFGDAWAAATSCCLQPGLGAQPVPASWVGFLLLLAPLELLSVVAVAKNPNWKWDKWH